MRVCTVSVVACLLIVMRNLFGIEAAVHVICFGPSEHGYACKLCQRADLDGTHVKQSCAPAMHSWTMYVDSAENCGSCPKSDVSWFCSSDKAAF
jgi:hypothetical protein